MNIFPLLHDKADLKLLEEIVVKEDDDVENDKEEQLLVAQSTIKKDWNTKTTFYYTNVFSIENLCT